MQEKTVRDSNFELLRIIAMMMIIAHHIVFHCVNKQLTNMNYIERFGTGYFNHPFFYKKLFLLAICCTLGHISNALFILISGYFLASKPNIDLGKTGKKLLEQLGFSSIILTGISYITGTFLSKRGMYMPLQDIHIVNGMSWYIGYYFLVLFIAAVFLNKKLAAVERTAYRSFLIVIFAITQFSWSGGLADNLAVGLRTLLIGIFLYAEGGYLRKYQPFKNIKTFVFPLIIAAMYAIVYVSYHNDVINNIQANAGNDPFVQTISDYENYHPLIIIVAICIFELFSRIHFDHNKIINFIGGSTLMIYLLHDNAFCYALWDTQDWITVLWNSPMRFVGKMVLWTLYTFLCGLGFYCLFMLCRKWIPKLKPLVTVTKQ